MHILVLKVFKINLSVIMIPNMNILTEICMENWVLCALLNYLEEVKLAIE